MTTAALAIIGMPGTGKTTLANALGDVLHLRVLHTDDWKHLPWSEQAQAGLGMVDVAPDAFIIEGITVARLFRYGFHPDCVIYLASDEAYDAGRNSSSLQSLLMRGLLDYDRALVRGKAGRVLHVPARASCSTVLWLMGILGPEEGN